MTAPRLHLGPFILLREFVWSVGESLVEVLREGTFFEHVKGGREVTFTAADLEKMVTVYAQAQADGQFPGGGAKLDVNHALATGSSDPASTAARGRALRLEVHPHIDRETGQPDGTMGLFAVTMWTEAGAAEANAGAFAGVSVELVSPEHAMSKATGEKLGGWLLTGFTLCNDPFIPGLADVVAPILSAGQPAVLLSSRAFVEPIVIPPETRTMKTLLTALGVDSGASEEVAVLALKAVTDSRNELLRQRDDLLTKHAELEADRVEAFKLELVAKGHCEPAKLAAVISIFTHQPGTFAERKAFTVSTFPAGFVRNMADTGDDADAGESHGDKGGSDGDDEGKLLSAIESKHAELLQAHRETTGQPAGARMSWELLQTAEREVFADPKAQSLYLTRANA